jgi:hypothetical protein
VCLLARQLPFVQHPHTRPQRCVVYIMAEHQKVCAIVPTAKRPVPSKASSDRLEAVRLLEKAWANGTNIRYILLEGPDSYKTVVRQTLQDYRDFDIGLTFQEVRKHVIVLQAVFPDVRARYGIVSRPGQQARVRSLLRATLSHEMLCQ